MKGIVFGVLVLSFSLSGPVYDSLLWGIRKLNTINPNLLNMPLGT